MTNIIKDKTTVTSKFDTEVLKKGAIVKVTAKGIQGEGRTQFGVITNGDGDNLSIQIINANRDIVANIQDYTSPFVYPYRFEISSIVEVISFVEPDEVVEDVEPEPEG